MLKLLYLLKPHYLKTLLVLGLLFCAAMADLTLPTLMADIVNFGVVKSDISYILRTGGLMLAVATGGILCALASSFLSSRIALGFSRALRLKLFSRIEHFSSTEFDKFGTASLITRTTNDVSQVQQAVTMMLGIFVRAPIMGIGGIVMAVTRDRHLASVFLVAIPILVIALIFIAWRGVPLFREMQERLDQLNLVIREKLMGIRVIRAFDRVDDESQRFDQANSRVTQTGIKQSTLMSALMPLMMLIMNFTVIAVVWMGKSRLEQGTMQIGDIMAFIQYALQILFALMLVSMLFLIIPRSQVSAQRINEVLDTVPDLQHPVNPVTAVSSQGHVTFEGVTFKYPGAETPALLDVSFEALPGEITAIIGSTGAGKSTLVSLLPRFYDPCSGSVRVDGVDTRQWDPQALRSKMGYVPQKIQLFSGSVRDNLCFGLDGVSDETLWLAVGIAQASPFIQALDGQLDARVTQGGTNLSGGQKQRLAIARALVRKPSIYIFDDSFSALDFKTDAALRKALKEETASATFILVAQRITTVMDADCIVVINEGRVAGTGDHRSLMETCEVYREIVYSQLSQEELPGELS